MVGLRSLTGAAASVVIMAAASIAAAQPAPPPPVADQPPIDPARLALAHKLFDMQMGQSNLPALLKSMDQQMMSQAMAGAPGADAAMQRRVTAAVEKAQADLLPHMLDGMAAAYARHLSQKELEDAVAFYSSPSGQAILQKSPVILAEAFSGLSRWVPRMRQAVFDAVCADNGCTPAQREAMAKLQAQANANVPPPPGR